MEHKLLLSLVVVSATQLCAQLSPGTDAPLIAHLIEVNREWRTMNPDLPGGDRVVHFANEADRIATHLQLVRENLAQHPSEGLDASTAAKRTHLLHELGLYAERGLFPQNEVLPVRNPVFIDPVGTACAVGQLMIQSGNADLALRIQQEMNLAYVHDMHRSDVDGWAVDHGFSENELAWIQPAYPPNFPWEPLGAGTNGRVDEVLRLNNGDLIVAGDFTDAGGTACTRVARWDGSTYTAMGALVDGDVLTGVEFNGEIYLGGSFSGGSYDLLRWTGSTWAATTAFLSKFAIISDLLVHNGQLHAAGASSGFAGVSYEVRRLEGNNWEQVGQALNGSITSIDVFNDTLVCAGAFTGNFPTNNTDIQHVARLEGNTWAQLNAGLDGMVHDLLVHDGHLYAGGDCVSEVATYFGFARLASGGAQWEQLMPNIGNYIYSPLDMMVGIHTMVAHGDAIYLGGDFMFSQDIMTYARGLIAFHGSADAFEGMCDFFGPVKDLEMLNGTQLVAAGASDPWSNIIFLDLAMSVPDNSAAPITLNVWPNPSQDELNINLTGATSGGSMLSIVDASGREVMNPRRVQPVDNIDVRELPAGAYTIRVTGDSGIRTATFLKH